MAVEDDAAAIVVRVDETLIDLVPGFHARASEDVGRLPPLIVAGGFEEVRLLAHRLRGTGGMYGYAGLVELGARLEASVEARDRDGAIRAAHEMGDYLRRVRWRPE